MWITNENLGLNFTLVKWRKGQHNEINRVLFVYCFSLNVFFFLTFLQHLHLSDSIVIKNCLNQWLTQFFLGENKLIWWQWISNRFEFSNWRKGIQLIETWLWQDSWIKSDTYISSSLTLCTTDQEIPWNILMLCTKQNLLRCQLALSAGRKHFQSISDDFILLSVFSNTCTLFVKSSHESP